MGWQARHTSVTESAKMALEYLILILFYAVSITLTPVAHGKEEEVENHRVIKINSERSHIDIGRASKNPNKGLLVGSDNAWFECPILSRYHAKFTASLLQKVSPKLRRTLFSYLALRQYRKSIYKIATLPMELT